MSPSLIPGLPLKFSMIEWITVDIVPVWKMTCGPIVTIEPSAR